MPSLSGMVSGTLRGTWWEVLQEFLGVSHNDDGTISDEALEGTTLAIAVDDHIANVSNPHSVTKTQVGLGNADNTTDANKPVSTATQTALDLKADETDLDALSDTVTTQGTTLATKADQADLDITDGVVSGHTSTLATHTTQIAYTNPGGTGTDGQVLTVVAGSPSWAAAGTVDAIYDIRDYGAVGDGVTDDTDAIMDAIDACGAAGGGIVYVPPGEWFVDTPDTSAGGGLLSIIHIRHDNIWLKGDGPQSRIIADDATSRLLMIAGAAKTGGYSAMGTGSYTSLTTYTINAATAGDMSITCTTAADALNFSVGDFVFLRTGQLTGSGTGEPDSELNKVVSVDGGTGVVGLLLPLLKDYVQEYFVSGTGGHTTRSATANLATLGIANANDVTIQNVRISDLTFDQSDATSASCIAGGQAWGLRIEDCIFTGGDVSLALGTYRWGRIQNNIMEMTRGSLSSPSAGFAAKGSSDIVVEGNFAWGKSYAVNWQANEGACNITFVNNLTISPAGSAATQNQYAALGRPRNHILIGNTFVNGGTGAVIKLDMGTDTAATGCSAIVSRNIISGKTFTSGIAIGIPNVIHRDNLIKPASSLSIYDNLGFAYGSTVPVQPQILWAWVTGTNHQEVTLGRLPEGTIPRAVYLEVSTAFNSDGTDTISLGSSSGAKTAWMAATDVSTTGVKSVTIAITGYRAAALDVIAYYTAGGSAPTTGRALVGIEYTMAPQRPSEGA